MKPTALFFCFAMAWSTTPLATDFTSTYFNPQEGLRIFQSIPEQDRYNIFCELQWEFQSGDYRVAANNETPSVRRARCFSALKVIESRLIELTQGINIASPISTDFLTALNSALVGTPGKSAVYRSKSNYNDLPITNSDSLDEILLISQSLYESIQIDVYYRNYNFVPGTAEQLPLREFDENTDYDFIRIFGIKPEDVDVFLDAKSRDFSQLVLQSQPVSNYPSLDAHLWFQVRQLLIAQPFDNGNTRTTHLMFNMLRLCMGFPPVHSTSVLDLKQLSSGQVAGAYYKYSNHLMNDAMKWFSERMLPLQELMKKYFPEP